MYQRFYAQSCRPVSSDRSFAGRILCADFYFFRKMRCEPWMPSTCLYSRSSMEAGYMLGPGGGELRRTPTNPDPSDKSRTTREFARVLTCLDLFSLSLAEAGKTSENCMGGARARGDRNEERVPSLAQTESEQQPARIWAFTINRLRARTHEVEKTHVNSQIISLQYIALGEE